MSNMKRKKYIPVVENIENRGDFIQRIYQSGHAWNNLFLFLFGGLFGGFPLGLVLMEDTFKNRGYEAGVWFFIFSTIFMVLYFIGSLFWLRYEWNKEPKYFTILGE